MAEDPKGTKIVSYRSDYSNPMRNNGYEDGLELGALSAMRRVLIQLLELIPGGITAEHRKRIEASTDRRALEDWFDVIVRLRSQIPPTRE
jgi:hypothetical protein